MAAMDLISDLSEEVWMKRSEIPQEQDLLNSGYCAYNVFKRHQTEEKTHEIIYYLKRDDGQPSKARLNGLRGKRDPLKEIRNCFLKMASEEGNDPPHIIGIAVDDDWVEHKNSQTNGQ